MFVLIPRTIAAYMRGKALLLTEYPRTGNITFFSLDQVHLGGLQSDKNVIPGITHQLTLEIDVAWSRGTTLEGGNDITKVCWIHSYYTSGIWRSAS